MSSIQLLSAASGGPPGGGGGFTVPKVLFVAANGNDATAEVGNPAKPFLTMNAAYAAGLATAAGFVVSLGVGTFYLELDPGDLVSTNMMTVHGMGSGRSIDAVPTMLVVRPTWWATSSVENMNGQNAPNVLLTCQDLFIDCRLRGQDSNTSDENTYYTGSGGGCHLTLRDCGVKVDNVAGGGNSVPGSGQDVLIGGMGWWLSEVNTLGIAEFEGGALQAAVINVASGMTNIARCSYSTLTLFPSTDYGGNASY